jgi:hypothetical protein
MITKQKIATIITLMLLLSCFAVSLNFASAVPSTYTYWFRGPYSLSPNGELATGNQILVTASWVNDTSFSFMLNGTISEYQLGVTSLNQISEVTWNASSALNFTSTMQLQPIAANSVVYIPLYIPSSNEPATFYSFQVTDFVGVTNPWITVSANVNGIGQDPIYTMPLNNTGTPSFLLQQFHTYSITISSDQGSFTQNFIAGLTYSNSIQILQGMFPTGNFTILTASANRLTNSTININYYDPSSNTSSLTITVTHLEGASVINDETYTPSTTTSYNLILTVDASTDYTVTITSISEGVTSSWKIAVPAPIIATNPFNGLFNFLGNWPAGIDPAQLIGAFIVMCFLGVGSFRSTGFSCVMGFIIGGILTAMGWLQIGVPILALGGFLAIWIAVQEAKDQQGDN